MDHHHRAGRHRPARRAPGGQDGRRCPRRVHRPPPGAEPVHPDIGDGPRRLGAPRGRRHRPHRRRGTGQGRPGPPGRRDGQSPSSPPTSCPGCSPCTRRASSSGSTASSRQPRAADRAPWHARRQPPPGRTIGRSGDLATDEALIAGLLASPKERREHAYVIDGLRAPWARSARAWTCPASPTVLELRNVSHLATALPGCCPPSRPGRSAAPLTRAPAGPGRSRPRASPRIRASTCPAPSSRGGGPPHARGRGTPTDEAVPTSRGGGL